mmetsp:Transcript_28273/g.65610  ORF Transcript_28273/g.65610 Transcript_28273/m.65610 type:complete len:239 (-) Transcript_28273:113-829(-)
MATITAPGRRGGQPLRRLPLSHVIHSRQWARRSLLATCLVLGITVETLSGALTWERFAFTSAPGRPASDLGSRRAALLGGATGLAVTHTPLAAHAALVEDEFAGRIKKGYAKLGELLGDWEEKTTSCDALTCKRDPDVVRSYLGCRSTEDVLFGLGTKLIKTVDKVDPDDFEAFQEAVEKWNSAVSAADGDAYISSFGEFNPGGGKETVEKYLDRAKQNVEIAKEQLQIIAKALQITL